MPHATLQECIGWIRDEVRNTDVKNENVMYPDDMTTGFEPTMDGTICKSYRGYKNGKLVYEDMVFEKQLDYPPYEMISGGPSEGYVKCYCGCLVRWENRKAWRDSNGCKK